MLEQFWRRARFRLSGLQTGETDVEGPAEEQEGEVTAVEDLIPCAEHSMVDSADS